jgi:alpha-mannosidase
LDEGANLALQLKRDVPVFWGIGDHGGGATREDLEKIKKFAGKEKGVILKHSTPDLFYEAIKKNAKDAPVHHGGLQRVFTGCYTSLSRLKREAVRSFSEMKQTEIISTIGWWEGNLGYPSKQLSQNWLEHLFNDFHDILPGSCTEPAERDALELYGRVRHSLRELKLETATALNKGKKFDTYIPITVLNSHPNLRRVPVEVECMISHRPKWQGLWHLKLFSTEGKEIPCQEEQPEALLPFNAWRRKICFMADLSSPGRANFYAEAAEGKKIKKVAKPALDFKLNTTSGLIEKMGNENFPNYLDGHLLKPLVIEDLGDSWGTDCWNYRQIVGEFSADPNSMRIIEQGPIRTIHQSIHRYHHSKMTMNLVSYTEWPVLEYRIRIQWNEVRKRLKLSIPTLFKESIPKCEIPGGYCRYPADGEEYVHGRWILLGNSVDGRNPGIAVISNGLHGFDCLNGEIRISVLRSAAYCHEKGQKLSDYPDIKYMDQGNHEIRLLIVPGNYKQLCKTVDGLADWLNTPPAVYSHLPFGKSDQSKRDFIKWDAKSIRLLALKRAEADDAMIIRLQETSGQATNCRISLSHPNIRMNIQFKPLEIRTFMVKKDGSWQEVDPIFENPIS